jgi:serine O-acetyltransferase
MTSSTATSRSLLSHIKHDVRIVLDRDPAARSWISVALLYPGLHAIWAHRISHKLWQKRRYYLARWFSQVSRFWTLIEIHPGATIGENCFIDHGAGVVIGETAVVGNNVTIYQGVTLGGTSLEPIKRHPTIGDDVIVGAGAKVLGNIHIGNGSRIGANAVVVRSVKDHSVVVGVPGQVIAQTQGDVLAKGSGGVIPDPVGHAVHSLLNRVDELEKQVLGTTHGTDKVDADGDWQYEGDFVI